MSNSTWLQAMVIAAPEHVDRLGNLSGDTTPALHFDVLFPVVHITLFSNFSAEPVGDLTNRCPSWRQ